MFREITITDDVLNQARSLGMYGAVASRLKKMARLAAPFKHPDGNRRFEGWVLNVVDGTLKAISKYDPERVIAIDCKPAEDGATVEKKPFILEEGMIICPDCENDGGICFTCDGTGKVREDFPY